ncbi:hypothetical protein PHLGIDRAFT_426597 [Phlebiopsis gigantea 11061_1 CR5-6]|uniref:Uncharacterized protein n=1 Tax=Phlebiopsis gigantea (strain 11061_1 CR5-6) TaxID=745531 RepID=A0A0C3PLA5_PHLG1|nr:hypothetical protein PHLGIDRAFT_426597 [Phlebiopsis gigantea 11061_1 CR5-6]
MDLHSPAHRVGTSLELVNMVLCNLNPISWYHNDLAHKKEREEQLRDGPSDAHTLYCAALVSRLWRDPAVSLLWRDVSLKELEIMINGERPFNKMVELYIAEENLARMIATNGRYIKTLYFSSGLNSFLSVVLPGGRNDIVDLPNLETLHLELWHAEAYWYAWKFVASPKLRTLELLFHSRGIPPNSYSNIVSDWFGKAADVITQWPTRLRLIVEDPKLWNAIKPAVTKFLLSSTIANLEFHVDMLTADFVESLRPMTNQYTLLSIRCLGESTLPLLDNDNDNHPNSGHFRAPIPFIGRSSIEELALCGTLAQMKHLLTTSYDPEVISHLDLTLRNLPTQTSFSTFLWFIGLSCPTLEALRVVFPKSTMNSNHLPLDWMDLEPLSHCGYLEELEIINGPGIELRNTDVTRIANAWPNLRVLKIFPHEGRDKADAMLSLGGLFYLAAGCPNLADVILPFSFCPTSDELFDWAMDGNGYEDLADDDVGHLLRRPPSKYVNELDFDLDRLARMNPSNFKGAEASEGEKVYISRTNNRDAVFATPQWSRKVPSSVARRLKPRVPLIDIRMKPGPPRAESTETLG